jgi:hypothetical protein
MLLMMVPMRFMLTVFVMVNDIDLIEPTEPPKGV